MVEGDARPRPPTGGSWTALENVLAGLADPAVLVLRLGTRLHPEAADARAVQQLSRTAAKGTSAGLGASVTGPSLCQAARAMQPGMTAFPPNRGEAAAEGQENPEQGGGRGRGRGRGGEGAGGAVADGRGR